MFQTNPEGKLVISEEAEGEEAGQRREVEGDEDMDIDEVIPRALV